VESEIFQSTQTTNNILSGVILSRKSIMVILNAFKTPVLVVKGVACTSASRFCRNCADARLANASRESSASLGLNHDASSKEIRMANSFAATALQNVRSKTGKATTGSCARSCFKSTPSTLSNLPLIAAAMSTAFALYVFLPRWLAKSPR
jgi:hypothetical protein